ncbi:hypothetical protein Btru_075815 [Bulinus truncatus]|nr:hypothetical protein Btru_075815 [Bulinus truncatus]
MGCGKSRHRSSDDSEIDIKSSKYGGSQRGKKRKLEEKKSMEGEKEVTDPRVKNINQCPGIIPYRFYRIRFLQVITSLVCGVTGKEVIVWLICLMTASGSKCLTRVRHNEIKYLNEDKPIKSLLLDLLYQVICKNSSHKRGRKTAMETEVNFTKVRGIGQGLLILNIYTRKWRGSGFRDTIEESILLSELKLHWFASERSNSFKKVSNGKSSKLKDRNEEIGVPLSSSPKTAAGATSTGNGDKTNGATKSQNKTFLLEVPNEMAKPEQTPAKGTMRDFKSLTASKIIHVTSSQI